MLFESKLLRTALPELVDDRQPLDDWGITEDRARFVVAAHEAVDRSRRVVTRGRSWKTSDLMR
jgi:hypothetical protein